MDTNSKRKHARTQQDTGSRWHGWLFACLATLVAAPAGGATTDIQIPSTPLQSGTPYPAPNVMFILDDSGSMEFVAMPKDVSSMGGLDNDIFDKSYVHNTIYYNPNIDYEPWRKADGSRYDTGTRLDAVWGDASLLSDKDDISDDTHVYFVPKQGITDYNDQQQYYRYEIRHVSNDGVNGPRVIQIAPAERTGLLDQSGLSSSSWLYFQVSVPAGMTLTVQTSGNSGFFQGTSDLYVRRGANPTASNYDGADTGSGNNDRVVLEDVQGGTYYIGLRARSGIFGSGFSGVRLVAYYETSGTSFATPVAGRSEADEMENFATWWSYHRTRMKVAKAAASEAFNQLGDNFRVGYDSIWNNMSYRSNTPDYSTNSPAYPIPTDVEDGLFRKKGEHSDGANRAKWFEFLHAAEGNGGTPLHDALWRAGQYYESSAPWKSGEGDDISCRLSFSILTTDGYWNSRSRNSYGGNSDGTAGDVIQRKPGAQGGPYQYQPTLPYKDNRSDTLADVAMYYWKRDLRPSLDNDVPTSAADPAFWQHMTTFGISIGLSGELDPVKDLVDLTSGAKSWPDPKLNDNSGSAAHKSRIDDLFHASLNGRGQFVAATDPERFVRGLLDALTTIAQRPGSASNVTANSTSFNTDTRAYQAKYTSGTWTGELASYVATSAGVQETPEWLASAGIPAYGSRNIITWDGDGGASFPTSKQIEALDMSDRAFSAATGAENAAYVAGDQSKELLQKGGTLRNRATVLGDIVNSSPIYVTDSDTLFVGANDGMLHAFDAKTGQEIFAYVPGGISLADLATLSDPYYTHKYFVDGPVTVSAKSQTKDKNYLVGALGRGGRGVFGLDVTDPKNFDEDDVLWEFTDDNDMGMVLGEPLVVTLNDASKTKAVVVSNGINSPDGSATLFVLNLATGAEIAEIEAGTAGANGLFAPRGWDNDGNGTVDFIYAGDLQGNLWKFDLSDSSKDKWKVANQGKPMFTARDDENNRQPITAGLALARNPDTKDVWVFAGTGRFISEGDLTSVEVQTLYGVIDSGAKGDDTASEDHTVAARTSTSNGDLVEREIISVSADKRVRVFTSPKRWDPDGEIWVDVGLGGKKGWYVDFDDPTEGERVVSGLRVLGTVLIASSIIPPQGSSTCDAGGTGYINAVDAFTGTSPRYAFFDVNGDGKVDDNDLVTVTVDGKQVQVAAGSYDPGVGMPTRPTIIDKLLIVGGSTGQIASVAINPQGVGARRVTWREIVED